MNLNSLLLLALTLVSGHLYGQSDTSKLIGSWKCIHEEYSNKLNLAELIDGLAVHQSDSSIEAPDFRINFRNNGKLIYYSLGRKYKSEYSVDDNILNFGGQSWKIESLTESTFVISFDKQQLLGRRTLIFNRVFE